MMKRGPVSRRTPAAAVDRSRGRAGRPGNRPRSGPTGRTATRSRTPSSTRACGAILALLPYWSELATAIRSDVDRLAVRPLGPQWHRSVVRLKNAAKGGAGVGGQAPADEAVESPRDVGVEPEPHGVDKQQPVGGSGVQLGDRGRRPRRRARARLRANDFGSPRWRARPLPGAAGTRPIAAGVWIRAWATSLTVPSPPTATTRRHPAATASRAISVAWPGPSVQTSSASSARLAMNRSSIG